MTASLTRHTITKLSVSAGLAGDRRPVLRGTLRAQSCLQAQVSSFNGSITPAFSGRQHSRFNAHLMEDQWESPFLINWPLSDTLRSVRYAMGWTRASRERIVVCLTIYFVGPIPQRHGPIWSRNLRT